MVIRDMDLDSRRDHERLVAFLHENDVTCPLCEYNVRNLQSGVCPECQTPLILGLRDPQFGLFIVAIAPFIAAGGGALLILAFTFAFGNAPGEVVVTGLLLVVSGFLSLPMLRLRRRFLRLSRSRQLTIGVANWLVHFVGWCLIAILIH